MAARMTMFEILDNLKTFTGEGSIAKKVEWLKQHDNPTLRMLLKHNFDASIQYNLPEGEPPFKRNPNPVGLSETNLYAESRKLSYLWLQPTKSALQDLSTEQRAQLTAAQENEEAKGRDFVSADTTFKDAEQELIEAKQALLEANTRVNKATAALQAARQQLNIKRVEAERATQFTRQMRESFERTNQELVKRDTPEPVSMPKYRLELLFIQLLESLHPTEADVLLAVKNKTLSKKFAINKDIVKKAFPDILK